MEKLLKKLTAYCDRGRREQNIVSFIAGSIEREVKVMPALTEKDKQEGKELIDMLESLPVEEKKQARIYIGALHDRQMILKEEPEEEV